MKQSIDWLMQGILKHIYIDSKLGRSKCFAAKPVTQMLSPIQDDRRLLLSSQSGSFPSLQGGNCPTEANKVLSLSSECNESKQQMFLIKLQLLEGDLLQTNGG